MTVVIAVNPGTGPVADATEANAAENAQAFAADLAARGVLIKHVLRRSDADLPGGRYEFDLFFVDPQPHEEETREPRTKIQVSMPGLPLARVRYMDDSQNIWDFPRLYIDGSSWVWKFAVDVCVPDRK